MASEWVMAQLGLARAYAHAKRHRQGPPHNRISSRSGKMPTPTFPLSSAKAEYAHLK